LFFNSKIQQNHEYKEEREVFILHNPQWVSRFTIIQYLTAGKYIEK